MSTVFFVLTLVAAVAVVVSLMLGLFVMAKGGEADKKYSNKLMQARVMLQGLAILLVHPRGGDGEALNIHKEK